MTTTNYESFNMITNTKIINGSIKVTFESEFSRGDINSLREMKDEISKCEKKMTVLGCGQKPNQIDVVGDGISLQWQLNDNGKFFPTDDFGNNAILNITGQYKHKSLDELCETIFTIYFEYMKVTVTLSHQDF